MNSVNFDRRVMTEYERYRSNRFVIGWRQGLENP
jgi:hypothetical protein